MSIGGSPIVSRKRISSAAHHKIKLNKYEKFACICLQDTRDKVKPIELNEEASVDTQSVSNTRLAHFEDFNNEVIIGFVLKLDVIDQEHPSSPLFLMISPTYQHVLQTEDEARKITYRTAVVPCKLLHKSTARICILVKCPGDYYLHLDRIAADGHDMFIVSDRLQDMVGKVQMKLTGIILDTELKLDIRKLESLGLSSQEELVP
ncbi:unnamed protein product [Rotaria sp. Silwood1]|nr:unnamed protein product [Rotaria sp. Silwood1]